MFEPDKDNFEADKTAEILGYFRMFEEEDLPEGAFFAKVAEAAGCEVCDVVAALASVYANNTEQASSAKD